MIRFAFREWAAICRALVGGSQSVILRKGGIAEDNGVFTPDHRRFWLFPGGFHQRPGDLKLEAAPVLQSLEDSPFAPPGILRLQYYAEATVVRKLETESVALALDEMHLWTAETIGERFRYRRPGWWLLMVRVYRNPHPIDLPILPEWAACKTWIDTGIELEVESILGEAVIDDETHYARIERLDELLHPTAMA